MIEPEELRALSQRIIQSGELGRSRTYASILEYLVEQAINGTTPKEISIALEVLGRDPSFDVGKDSIVRVHMYHLRNKLNAYFARLGKHELYRFDIPKGQYMLTYTLNQPEEAEAPVEVSITGKPLQRKSFTPWLATVAIGLLLLNLFNTLGKDEAAAVTNPYAATRLWAPLFDDALPILILVGDYYIMGELDELGRINRMVREFDINSRQELLQQQQAGRGASYLNLDLGYTPTSIPTALVQVLKVFGADSSRVRVKLMSDFTSNDLVGNHIVYLGYLSGLQSLNDLVFADSGLATGNTFDELINLNDDTRYASSSGLSTGDDSYRDYGMLSTFPAPGGTQYLFLTGMRDEGLVNLAEEVALLPSLAELEQQFPAMETSDTAFEALYEVLGFSNTNIDAKLVYSNNLDTEVLWQTRLIGAP